MKSALNGIRVLDFTRWLAGPYATTILGDMGADVIKIERPGEGDGTRNVDDVFVKGLSSYHLGLNRSKRSIAIDVADPDGRDIVEDGRDCGRSYRKLPSRRDAETRPGL